VGGEVQADVDEDHHRAARRQQQHEEADELAPALGPGNYVINILPPKFTNIRNELEPSIKFLSKTKVYQSETLLMKFIDCSSLFH